MPASRTSMRRTKEILRLRFEFGLSLRQIARSLAISVGTVHDYLQRAEAAEVRWPLPEGWDDDRLETTLFRQTPTAMPPRKALPDFAMVHQQLQKPHARWHEQIGDPTVADGILDRLVHNAHRIEMRGDSMRKVRGNAAG